VPLCADGHAPTNALLSVGSGSTSASNGGYVRRLGWAAILLLVTACNLESQLPPCDCPNLEAIVWNIDWLDDGSTADDLSSRTSDEGIPNAGVHFDRFNNADEAEQALRQVLDRLQAAGLGSVTTLGLENEVRVSDNVTLAITAFFAEEEADSEFSIDVFVSSGDEGATQALQPLVDALGTIE